MSALMQDRKINSLVPVMESDNRGGFGLATFLQDQTTDLLNLILMDRKFTGLTLATVTSKDTFTITLSSGHGLTNANCTGYLLQLTNGGAGEFYRGYVKDVTGDVVTLDTLICRNYDAETTEITVGNTNLSIDDATGVSIDGSTSPVIYNVMPTETQVGDITRVILGILSEDEMDFSLFGSTTALSCGLLFRVKKQDGNYTNLFTIKSNYDLAMVGFEQEYLMPKANRLEHGMVGRVTFAGQENHGVVVRLDGSLGEELQVVVCDAMDSDNFKVTVLCEGSVVQE